ncbi:MAG: epoxyqueuosine reductase QueH [Proteobacteria bacterium]|nr:epoxyqueuosine reductase QueH [Alphaproteobacteria bacterium]NCC02803.1 epoxyqueuosine reductase QueH [Pseudomonadota bacterium]
MEPDEKILLHVCCAPCSCEIIEGMLFTGLRPTLYFYNPNIHPQDEYDIRKNEVIRFAASHGIPFVDADYDTDHWFARVKGLEQEPERGRRCSACFAFRMERTALYAHENGFRTFATSLSISRHKNQSRVHQAGEDATIHYADLRFWAYNWRQRGGSDRGAHIAKTEGFYRQNYCGCVFSRRDRAAFQKQRG